MTIEPIFYDSETCGLHGVMVLLQYAVGDGPIFLRDIWMEPVGPTLNLIESMMTHEGGVVGFNLSFDHFHLQKIYNMFSMLREHIGDDAIPFHYIELLADIEPLARDGNCIKPVKAMDLMLFARKGEYQSLMARKPIFIRRVPTQIAYLLRAELEKRIALPEIYFTKSKKKGDRWVIKDVHRPDGSINPDFKTLMLDFKSSSGLKPLCEHIFGKDRFKHTRAIFSQIDVDKKYRPKDKGTGYAPYAKAFEPDGKYKTTWPAFVEKHILHWHLNEDARQYAEDDVTDTRNLYRHFNNPELGDDDSELACMAGSVRWRGYPIDRKAIKNLRDEARQRIGAIPRTAAGAKAWLMEILSPEEAAVVALDKSTKKQVLIEIKKLKQFCPECIGEGCDKCEAGKLPHPAAERAGKILDARQAKYEYNFYDKLIRAKRLHPSFEIIGAKSSRMSGRGGDLNSQGIKKDKKVRCCFTLHKPGEVLCGGDFESFEVAIAVANYNDEVLNEELKSGKKIHGLFGTLCYPQFTYEEIVASSGAKDDYYTKAKSGLFALIYGGNEVTLMSRLNVAENDAIAALNRFRAKYKGVAKAQDRVKELLGPMRQPNGIGTNVEWHDTQDYIESMLGFRRFFTLERQICKILYDLARSLPKAWREIKMPVMRRPDRIQTAHGATQSAIYGAAFQIQSGDIRAGGNHEIQSTGAGITKRLQRNIWDHQPCGVHEWLVQPMNIHDEIMSRTHPSVVDAVAKTVHDTVESFRPIIPMIGMEWKVGIPNWAEK